MKQTYWPYLATFTLMLTAISFSAMAATLRIGTISTDPAKEVAEFQSLANYLGKHLGNQGIESVEIVITHNIQETARLLETGKLDLYIDSPFPVLLVHHLTDNRYLLRRWKKGVPTYSGVIFAKRNAGIRGIGDLKGKMIAFEEPFSTASYYLPRYSLLKTGLKINQKDNSSDQVGTNEIGYLFSGDDRNTMAWVLTGRVAAGAINDEKYGRLVKNHENQLVVLSTTLAVPRHIVTCRKTLDERLVQNIRSLLKSMENSPEGLAALKGFNDTRRFDDLTEKDQQALELLHVEFDTQINLELSGVKQ